MNGYEGQEAKSEPAKVYHNLQGVDLSIFSGWGWMPSLDSLANKSKGDSACVNTGKQSFTHAVPAVPSCLWRQES